MPDTTIILSEVPIGRTVSQRQGLRIPDLLVAFGVDHAGVIGRRGYSIEEQGKPPDFVLEVASVTTGQNDYTQKRDDYAAFRVPEYWRFDPSGGEYHDAPLAGDHLVDAVYQPIEVVQFGESSYRGHSAVLGLDLCWEDGHLRWYDPASGRYLLTYDEEGRGAPSGRERKGRRPGTSKGTGRPSRAPPGRIAPTPPLPRPVPR